MAKFNKKSIHFVIFFSAYYKRLWNIYTLHEFPFKNVIFLTIEWKMYLKSLQKLRCLGWISKQDILRFAGKKNIVEFLEGWFRNQTLSLVHKKKTEHLFELSLSICVF